MRPGSETDEEVLVVDLCGGVVVRLEANNGEDDGVELRR